MTVIQVISIAIFYWHCKNIWNLMLIFGVILFINIYDLKNANKMKQFDFPI